ncbi:MAG: NACHT domain-containing protein [Planctomycetota bacterium]|nr:NACHT domain-containing protein [Planctomycetota bacterium]
MAKLPPKSSSLPHVETSAGPNAAPDSRDNSARTDPAQPADATQLPASADPCPVATSTETLDTGQKSAYSIRALAKRAEEYKWVLAIGASAIAFLSPHSYERPWIYGAAILLVAAIIVLCIFTVRKRNLTKREWSCFVAALTLGGTVISCNAIERTLLLKWFYPFSVAPCHSIRGKALEQWNLSTEATWPTCLESGQQGIRLEQYRNGGGSKSKLVSDLSRMFSPSDRARGQLTFLLGPAGSGKTNILKQWVAIAADNNLFDYCILIRLKKDAYVSRKGNSIETLSSLLKASYEGPSLDEEYFKLILKYESSLLVIDGLDEISPDSASKDSASPSGIDVVIEAAQDAIRQAPLTVIVGSRPEALYNSDPYHRGDLRADRAVRFTWLKPITDDDLNGYIRRAAEFCFNADASKAQIEPAISFVTGKCGKSIAIRDMCSEIRHLTNLCDKFKECASLTDFQILEKLIEKRGKDQLGSHKSTLGWDSRKQAIAEVAFKMSQAGKRTSDNHTLNLSGFVTIDERTKEYVFFPDAVRSYFVIRYIMDQPSSVRESIKEDGLHRHVLQDVCLLAANDRQLRELIGEDFRTGPRKYIGKIDLLAKIIGREEVRTKLALLAPGDLIDRFILDAVGNNAQQQQ